jgi:hypothetical protein
MRVQHGGEIKLCIRARRWSYEERCWGGPGKIIMAEKCPGLDGYEYVWARDDTPTRKVPDFLTELKRRE